MVWFTFLLLFLPATRLLPHPELLCGNGGKVRSGKVPRIYISELTGWQIFRTC